MKFFKASFCHLLTLTLLVSTLVACGGASSIDEGNGNTSQGQTGTNGNAGPNARAFPQHVEYAAGSLKISNRTQAQQDDDVRAAYDRWKQNYLALAKPDAQGRARYRVKHNAEPTNHTASEGQGYGFIIVAHMAGHDPEAKTIFDGLFRFAKDHRSENDPRLPDWYVNHDESPDNKGNTSAFDGDADAAYGLLLADAQWGSGGEINYRGEALTILQAIQEKEIGPDSKLPMLGDFASPNDPVYNQFSTRSSDFMYGHFKTFARVSGNNLWNEVATACQNATTHIQTNYANGTGLMPDFISQTSANDKTLRPAVPNFLEAATDGMYYANAGRVPWRMGTDWLLNGDTTSRHQVQKISTWAQGATGGDPMQVKPGYQLDGNAIPPADYWSTFYAAPLGVAAMATPGQQDWLNAIYDSVRNETQGYYEDSVTLLSMLVMTGNFWDPSVK